MKYALQRAPMPHRFLVIDTSTRETVGAGLTILQAYELATMLNLRSLKLEHGKAA